MMKEEWRTTGSSDVTVVAGVLTFAGSFDAAGGFVSSTLICRFCFGDEILFGGLPRPLPRPTLRGDRFDGVVGA